MARPHLRFAALAILAAFFAVAASPDLAALAEAGAFPTGPRDHPGTWTRITGLPLGPVHASTLPDGDVLLWASTASYRWDAGTLKFTAAQRSNTNLFCSGMAQLADGRLLAAGGHRTYDPNSGFYGLQSAEEYDATQGKWFRIPNMTTQPRWYPTAVTLGDGRAAVFSGVDGPRLNAKAEILNPETLTWEVKGQKTLPLFVRGHLTPEGDVFFTSPNRETSVWDPVTGVFLNGPTRLGGYRGGGASVVLDAETGRTLDFGGSSAGRTSEVYEPTDRAWKYTGAMNAGPRVWLNGVVLPTGDVLAVGGELTTTPLPAEWFDVDTGTWVTVATPLSIHVYHSTALLLADGSVVTTNQLPPFMEVYKPWYFFAGERPRIEVAPPIVAYGEPFPIVSPDAARVERAVLMRLGGVTHSLNTDQRLVELDLVKPGVGNVLVALAPTLPTVAPPGYYYLFLVDDRGVPSEGKLVQVGPGLGLGPQ